jgi:hypothetical protein
LRACDEEASAECFDAVAEAVEAAAELAFAADAVVFDDDDGVPFWRWTSMRPDAAACFAALATLRRRGSRWWSRRRPEPFSGDGGDFDRDGGAAGERCERGGEAVFAQDCG